MWLERALVTVGVICLGYYGYMSAEARQFQRQQSIAFEARLENAAPAAPASSEAPAAPGAPAGPATPGAPAAHVTPGPPALEAGVLALLDIPRLNISTPVWSGDDAATLDVAVGHLLDTPMPWEIGNSALAAHRDGLFRPLRDIRVGDEIACGRSRASSRIVFAK